MATMAAQIAIKHHLENGFKFSEKMVFGGAEYYLSNLTLDDLESNGITYRIVDTLGPKDRSGNEGVLWNMKAVSAGYDVVVFCNGVYKKCTYPPPQLSEQLSSFVNTGPYFPPRATAPPKQPATAAASCQQVGSQLEQQHGAIQPNQPTGAPQRIVSDAQIPRPAQLVGRPSSTTVAHSGGLPQLGSTGLVSLRYSQVTMQTRVRTTNPAYLKSYFDLPLGQPSLPPKIPPKNNHHSFTPASYSASWKSTHTRG